MLWELLVYCHQAQEVKLTDKRIEESTNQISIDSSASESITLFRNTHQNEIAITEDRTRLILNSYEERKRPKEAARNSFDLLLILIAIHSNIDWFQEKIKTFGIISVDTAKIVVMTLISLCILWFIFSVIKWKFFSSKCTIDTIIDEMKGKQRSNTSIFSCLLRTLLNFFANLIH